MILPCRLHFSGDLVLSENMNITLQAEDWRPENKGRYVGVFLPLNTPETFLAGVFVDAPGLQFR